MQEEKSQIKLTLIEAVDEGLLILGESGRKAIYFHIQNITSVNKEEIPNNLEALQRGIEEIFGAGARVIETAIVRSLCRKLGIHFEEDKDKSFVENIDCALNVAGMS